MLEINTYMLNDRKTPNANEYLLIFPNRQLIDFYNRWLKRDDIIYLTTHELANGGLIGLRYIDWGFVDERMDKKMINIKYPIKKGNN